MLPHFFNKSNKQERIEMKIIISNIIIIILFITGGNLISQEKEHDENAEVRGKQVEGGILYGNDFNLDPTAETMQVTIAQLFENPQNLEGKMIKTDGNITEVCQSMGCWAIISDGTNEIRLVTQHKFFLPKDCAQSSATVEGTFKVKEITEEQARHYNDEAKNPKVKTEDIKGPQKVLMIEASGVLIADKK